MNEKGRYGAGAIDERLEELRQTIVAYEQALAHHVQDANARIARIEGHIVALHRRVDEMERLAKRLP